jgi:hypothetical protein
MSAAAPTAALDAILRGEQPAWQTLRTTPAALLDACAAGEISALIHQKLRAFNNVDDWPEEVRRGLAHIAHASAAAELVRSREIAAAVDALARHGIRPVLLKGAPLAHTAYDSPALRPRADTDLLIRHEHIDIARRLMRGLGYVEALQSPGELLFSQFQMIKRDRFGVEHALDFHWKISTQSAFAHVFSYDELAAAATPVRPLGPHAIAPCNVHALLLACIHPVMHHRNVERLIWLYDIHLLASQLSNADRDWFVALAADKHVTAICAHQMSLSRARFGTPVPAELTRPLSHMTDTEPSAAYLRPARRWHEELASNVRGLPRTRDRLRLLREVVLPNPAYVLRLYGASGTKSVLLPALYLHRVLHGLWKVITRRK